MGTARILAVDDQNYFRSVIEGILTEDGYMVCTASSGQEALHALEREFFDIVVTDLVMPGMSGVELVSMIRDRWPEQEIVVVTGVGDVKTAVEAMKHGATEYLLKPIDRSVLLRALESILQSRRLRDEHSRLMAENLEYMGMLSVYERAVGLFATHSLEPLSERVVEGLCLETRAQGGVLWAAHPDNADRLMMTSVRGLVQVDDEPEVLNLPPLIGLHPSLRDSEVGAFLAPCDPLAEEAQATGDEAWGLYVPFYEGGQLIGLARLSDKIGGDPFGDRDRLASEKFVELAALALANSIRFRGLEQQSFRDPATGAYSAVYFKDIVQSEIQKSNRFARGFSILELSFEPMDEFRSSFTAVEIDQWLGAAVDELRRLVRITDVVGIHTKGTYRVLLPETDALGVAILKQRLRDSMHRHIDRGEAVNGTRPNLGIAAVTFPTDGSQLETLFRQLDTRMEEDRQSLGRVLGLEAWPFGKAVEALMELAVPGSEHLIEQVTRFFIDEVGRRPSDRGLLFFSPPGALSEEVRQSLERLRAYSPRTEIVLVSEERSDVLPGAPMTSVAKHRVGTHCPFLIYFGEGPAYAVVQGQPEDAEAGRTPVFQAHDRALVELLAFQLQSDLGIALTA
jgi:diguanylate cyclase (GGDEF)-like protein